MSTNLSRRAELRDKNAFTRVDLIVVCTVVFLCAGILLPALARTRNNNSLTQSLNNLRQLTSAWSMYAPDNAGLLVHSYPHYMANTNTWCDGSAQTGGDKGSFNYYGSDPVGIEVGGLWPYVRSLTPYKCPADMRTSSASVPVQFRDKPILRSYAMNCYLAGESFGTSSDVVITSPANADSSDYRFFIRESQVSRPSQVFLFIEEDSASINDGLFLVNMSTERAYELPTRGHLNSYPITFADGHVETYRLRENASIAWQPGDVGGFYDWAALTNVATFPTRLP